MEVENAIIHLIRQVGYYLISVILSVLGFGNGGVGWRIATEYAPENLIDYEPDIKPAL